MDGEVVDENVLVVANGRVSDRSLDCQLACIDALLAIQRQGSLVLDAKGRILGAYARHCNWKGAPGVGDEFFRYAYDFAPQLRQVQLEEDQGGDYLAFPPDPRLSSFDSDDRKWVAAVLEAGPDSVIINAADSDYREHHTALADNGVVVVELCESELKRAAD
jgi:hypothetical protein